MIRSTANIGFLVLYRPAVERIHAAAAADFDGMEMHWPFETPTQGVKSALAATGIKILAIKTAAGSKIGDFGLAGHEAQFKVALTDLTCFF